MKNFKFISAVTLAILLGLISASAYSANFQIPQGRIPQEMKKAFVKPKLIERKPEATPDTSCSEPRRTCMPRDIENNPNVFVINTQTFENAFLNGQPHVERIPIQNRPGRYHEHGVILTLDREGATYCFTEDVMVSNGEILSSLPSPTPDIIELISIEADNITIDFNGHRFGLENSAGFTRPHAFAEYIANETSNNLTLKNGTLILPHGTWGHPIVIASSQIELSPKLSLKVENMDLVGSSEDYNWNHAIYLGFNNRETLERVSIHHVRMRNFYRGITHYVVPDEFVYSNITYCDVEFPLIDGYHVTPFETSFDESTAPTGISLSNIRNSCDW